MNKAKELQMSQGREIRKEMGRHSVDCGEVLVSLSNGQIHLFGKVRAMRGHEGTFQSDLDSLIKSLRKRNGIRDVITDWTIVS